MTSRRRRTPESRRAGLTLLEVLVSMAIFMVALVAISSLFTWGHDRGTDAREKSQALRLAQSKLAEVVAGAQALTSQAETAYDLFPGYYWTLNCTANGDGIPNLYDVQVTVARKRDRGTSVQVHLAQMVLDPSQRGTTVPSQTGNSSSSSSSGTTGSQ